MKTLSLLAVLALLAGCTTTTTTTRSRSGETAEATAMTPDERRTINRRSYTKDDLQKTGQTDVGRALQTLDASVYISGGGR